MDLFFWTFYSDLRHQNRHSKNLFRGNERELLKLRELYVFFLWHPDRQIHWEGAVRSTETTESNLTPHWTPLDPF